MNKFTSKLLTKKRCVQMTFYLLCCFILSENAISAKNWNRNYIKLYYSKNDQSIAIRFEFIDYEFGQRGEHGLLEWGNFAYSTDGDKYHKLMSCKVSDQVNDLISWVSLTNELPGAKLRFMNTSVPAIGTMWSEDTNPTVGVNNIANSCFLMIRWLVPSGLDVKYILFSGKWYVNGLNCSKIIDGEVYEVPKKKLLSTMEKTELKQQNAIDLPENNAVNVYKDDDVIVVKGAMVGDNIKVYTTTGTLINSTFGKNEVIKIKLPKSQVCIVHIGKSRYKIAL